jgi:DHA1 family tetracycline resistance protein-like MFS transporter
MMLVLGIVVFVSFVGVGLVVPLFPFFGERAGAAPEMITTAMAVFALGQLISTPFWGWASDRVGRKPVLIVSLLGAAVSYLMLAFADSIGLLMLSRLVGGLMTGIGAVAFAIVADVASGPERARGMGRVSAAFSLGFILGPAFGGLLAGGDAAQADFRAIALTAAGIDVAAALLALLFVRETRPQRRAPAAAPGVLAPRAGLAATLRDPALLRLNLAHVLFAGSFAVVDSTLPLFASRAHDLSPREIGYAFTWMGLVSAVVQAATLGRIVRSVGSFNALLAGTALFGVGQLLVAASPTPWVLAGGLAALATGMSLFIAPASSLVAAVSHEADRGAVLGVFQGAGNLGRTITPLFSGLLFSMAGMASPFFAAAILVVPALALILAARSRAPALAAAGS